MSVCYIHVIAESYKLSKLYGPSLEHSIRVNLITEKINTNADLIVLDVTGEGLAGTNLLKGILNKIKCDLSKIKVISPVNIPDIQNVELCHTGQCNWFNFYTDLQKQNQQWDTIKLSHYFLALAHRPSISRALIIKDLLDNFKDISNASFGFSGGITKEMSKILYPYQTPLVFDVGLNTGVGGNDLHFPPVDKMFQSLFHIVLETNAPTDTEVRLTEKTFKPFAWHQIPLFYASPGHIEIVRSLGFDLFDDICDNHSYANFSKQVYRMALISTCKKLVNKFNSLEKLQDLRNQLIDRLKYNNNILEKYVNNDKHVWESNKAISSF